MLDNATQDVRYACPGAAEHAPSLCMPLATQSQIRVISA